MNLLERVVTLLRANLNTVVEKSNDPEKALRQFQLDMHNQLVQVKTEIAKAIAEKHVLQKHSEEQLAGANEWHKKAEQAIQQDKEEQARDALVHYNNCNRFVQHYQEQIKEQEQLITTMRSVLQKLERKMTEVEKTLELLEVRKRNTLIQQHVYDRTQVPDLAGDEQDSRERALEQRLNDITLEQKNIQKQLRRLRSQHSTRLQKTPRVNRHLRAPQEAENNNIQTGPLAEISVPAPLSRTTGSDEQAREQKKTKTVPEKRDGAEEEVSTERNLNLDYLKKVLRQSANNNQQDE